jgi:nucleoside-diphosphate-sugar epimerase
VAGVQLVYHVGATMRGRGWAEFDAATVNGTSNVVDSCLKHKVGRLVYVSSITVLDYSSQPAHAVVDESAPLERWLDKRGSYTRAKVLAERMVIDACHRRGLQAVVLRPGQIVGPGSESVPPYGTIALAGRWIAIGSGRLKLPLVHLDDVIEGLCAAATRPDVCGSIFHLVGSTPMTQREYIAWCRAEGKAGPGAYYIPRFALLAAGAVLDLASRLLGRPLPLSRYRIQSIKELKFDCSAARIRLGWQPTAGRPGGASATVERTRNRYERAQRSASA